MERKTVIKAVVSGAMILLLLRSIDLGVLVSTILSIPLWTATLVVTGYLLSQAMSGVKWQMLAKASGIDVPVPRAVRAYFVGMFANCFGFGLLGGDIARGVLIAHGRYRKVPGIATAFADRGHGLAVLALLGLGAALLFGSGEDQAHFVYALLGVLLLAGLGWVLAPPILNRLFSKSALFGERAREIAAAFPRDRKTLLAVTVISALVHSLQIWLHWVMGKGFGVDIPLAYLFVVIPFVNIVASLPISWNGLGIRENAYVFFLTPLYLTAERATAFGAVWLVAVTLSAAIGGILAVMSEDLAVLRQEGQTSPSLAEESSSTTDLKEKPVQTY